MKRSLVLLLACLSVAVTVGGCKMISKMMPASTIDNPKEGSPEMVIYKAIEAAQKPDTEAAWKEIRPLLHSSLTAMRNTEENFLNMNFAAFKRKVRFFTPDDSKPVYKLDYSDSDTGDEDVERRVFVVNEASDVPSPFRIARDPAANNEWRLKNLP